jgi:rhodanese-related sulfurtransferase
MRILFPILLLTFTATTFADDKPANKPAYQNIKPDDFEKLSKEKDTVILDVRTPAEFAAGHIASAVNIDIKSKDFDEKIATLDKGKTYLVNCAVGARSARACEKLGKLDFPHLYNLDGGITAWQRAGKPVEK